MVIGVVLDLVEADPMRALYLSAILNGLAAPPLIAMMLRLSNSAAIGRRKGGRLSDALVATALVVMALSAIVYVATLLA